jgi:hypothetical protein
MREAGKLFSTSTAHCRPPSKRLVRAVKVWLRLFLVKSVLARARAEYFVRRGNDVAVDFEIEP